MSKKKTSKTKFVPNSLCWYLVNYNNPRLPYIICRHFDTFTLAKGFKDKFNPTYEIEKGDKIIRLKVYAKKWVGDDAYAEGKSKWGEIPKEADTPNKRIQWRTRQRKKLILKKKENTTLTKNFLLYAIRNKPKLFIKRLRPFLTFELVYSNPPKGFGPLVKKYKYPNTLLKYAQILMCLYKHGYYKYYEPFSHVSVAEGLYGLFGEVIEKNRKLEWKKIKHYSIHTKEEIVKEFLERGFKPIGEINYDPYYAYVMSIDGKLVYPKKMYHNCYTDNKGLKLIDQHGYLFGISGYTRSQYPLKIKRT